MCNRILRVFAAVVPLVAVAVFLTFCATAADLRATVPFAFDVNGTHFEKGVYEVGRLDSMNINICFTNRDERTKRAVAGLPLASKNWQNPKLVFNVVNGKYHLAEIHMGSSGIAKRFPMKQPATYTAKRGGVERVEIALGR
jgi:hypothetical protein